MRRIATLLLVVTVSLAPDWAFAQSDQGRPTPVEAAGAMMPCIHVLTPGGVWVEGGIETAMVYGHGGEMFTIVNTHAAPPVELRFSEPDPGRHGPVHVLMRVERELVDSCFRDVLHR